MLGPLICLSLAAAPDFDSAVKPLFVRHCVQCHGTQSKRSGLRVDSVKALLEGGASGPAVVPGKSGESLLVKAIRGVEGVEKMPPKGDRLSEAEIRLIREWIDSGARPGKEGGLAAGPAKPSLWSFVAPRPVGIPAGPESNPIDRFVRERLRKEGLAPSPETDRRTLLNRLSIDLVGLPPSGREMADFLADNRPDAVERQVDRLLASPHYGERWGRWWLDQARYADSNGYSIDAARVMWKYRDWVIEALNADMPFDQFAIEQLAGDMLPGATASQKVATGFHRNTMINQEGGIDQEQFRVEAIVDRVNTTGTVFLGLSVGCAQCHDHKYDPISQKDYYRLFAFFNNCDEPTLDLSPAGARKRGAADRKKLAEIEKKLARYEKLDAPAIEALEGRLSPAARRNLSPEIQNILQIAINGRTPAQHEALVSALRNGQASAQAASALMAGHPLAAIGRVKATADRLALGKEASEIRGSLVDPVTAMVLEERKAPRESFVMLGGDFTRRGATVSASVPEHLPQLSPGAKANRLELARWLFTPSNPLTARVLANRVWQVYFGSGLVETENDFGTQGSPPSHPELLDWLALQVARDGYSLKRLHRLIVLSATYRQSSRHRPDLARVDARNRLLARQSRLRLEAELLRDRSLAVSGLLNLKVGGPSVFPSQPSGVYSFTQVPKQWKTSPGGDRYRRGLYTHIWRSAPHPSMSLFDAPDGGATCTRRHRSTTPLQALTLLNDSTQVDCARALARLIRDNTSEDEAMAMLFGAALGRDPRPEESSLLREFLAREKAENPGGNPHVALARVVLNSEEFLTRE